MGIHNVSIRNTNNFNIGVAVALIIVIIVFFILSLPLYSNNYPALGTMCLCADAAIILGWILFTGHHHWVFLVLLGIALGIGTIAYIDGALGEWQRLTNQSIGQTTTQTANSAISSPEYALLQDSYWYGSDCIMGRVYD